MFYLVPRRGGFASFIAPLPILRSDDVVSVLDTSDNVVERACWRDIKRAGILIENVEDLQTISFYGTRIRQSFGGVSSYLECIHRTWTIGSASYVVDFKCNSVSGSDKLESADCFLTCSSGRVSLFSCIYDSSVVMLGTPVLAYVTKLGDYYIIPLVAMYKKLGAFEGSELDMLLVFDRVYKFVGCYKCEGALKFKMRMKIKVGVSDALKAKLSVAEDIIFPK